MPDIIDIGHGKVHIEGRMAVTIVSTILSLAVVLAVVLYRKPIEDRISGLERRATYRWGCITPIEATALAQPGGMP